MRGFTLVELVVVIALVAVLAAATGLFIGAPLRGFHDQSRRAALVDAAALAGQSLARDLRAALPNSVRTNGAALELLLTLDGERYRSDLPGLPEDRLRFDMADDGFATFGLLNGGVVPPGARLAIYPLAQPGADPYRDAVLSAAASAITLSPAPVAVGAGQEYRVALNPPHPFAFDSPSHRVFLVQGPVSYFCDLANGRLLRYAGYGVQAAQPLGLAQLDALAPAVQVAGKLSACAFGYDPGTAQRNAVVTAALTLSQDGEDVRLLRQVHVENSP